VFFYGWQIVLVGEVIKMVQLITGAYPSYKPVKIHVSYSLPDYSECCVTYATFARLSGAVLINFRRDD
jgi:hypothetical protein